MARHEEDTYLYEFDESELAWRDDSIEKISVQGTHFFILLLDDMCKLLIGTA
jgi:hypothetical protein